MHIETIFCGNSLRNYNYLIGCEHTREAVLIDPLSVELCLNRAKNLDFQIRWIVNTHEHGDHVQGNTQMAKETNALIAVHPGALKKIPGATRGLMDGEIFQVGSSVHLKVLHTPGHTMNHLCLLSEKEPSCLFSGDTLFNAGAGHCTLGGDPAILYETFANVLKPLPEHTRIYPGHDYAVNNLGFALSLEPDNKAARTLLEQVRHQHPEKPYVTDLKMERNINPFLRLHEHSLIEGLRKAFPDELLGTDPRKIFIKLRDLRNRW